MDVTGANVWVTGVTESPDWVINGWRTTYRGYGDAFVAKIVDISIEGEGETPIEGEGEAKTILLPGDVPLELVWIPEGSFLMGRYPGEEGSYDREAPQHEVTLAQGFWMGKYEVTQEQWLAVRGAWPDAPPYVPSNSYGLGSTYPAYYISWEDTQDFIASLNAHIADTGQGPLTVRLPSEAEWEYACRAGTQTRFYFGDSLDCAGDCSDCVAGSLPGNRTDYMWYCGNNAINGTKVVGEKLPNTFGLYDMSGNLNEWCEDDWHSTYDGAPVDGSAWVWTPRSSNRVRRGGTWNYDAVGCRSALRNVNPSDTRGYHIGFRLAAVEWMPLEGEGEVPVEGEFPAEGEGESVVEGEGELPVEGEGEVLDEGEGEVLPEGEGEPAEGESSEGEGEYPPETLLLPGNVPLELVRIPAGSFQMG
ncbi:MAG: SUMF1/EgtB/PvdO family nonheme iron enzyme, partial [Candidatus Hydrogenedentes bacterium]|nr:SUMF1/EgtB/PvdO family nonheme iron enzyme [Candidatus Hydrogenedentota bacterium]